MCRTHTRAEKKKSLRQVCRKLFFFWDALLTQPYLKKILYLVEEVNFFESSVFSLKVEQLEKIEMEFQTKIGFLHAPFFLIREVWTSSFLWKKQIMACSLLRSIFSSDCTEISFSKRLVEFHARK